MWPLSQGEIAEVHENFLEVFLSDPAGVVSPTLSTSTKAGYATRIGGGGFPIALARGNATSRNRWFDDYTRTVLERDVLELARIRQRVQLPELLRRLASQTAQVLNLTTAANAARIDPTTAAEYVKLLEAVFLGLPP